MVLGRLAYRGPPGTVETMCPLRPLAASPVRRARRGVALVTMTIAMSAAASIVLVLVSLSLSDLRSTAATEDTETARGTASSAISEFTSELALEPNYYLERVHPLERARVCTGEPAAPVVQPGALWPATCGSTWGYVDPVDEAPARLEITPPSPSSRQLTVTAVGRSGDTLAAQQIAMVQPSVAAWTVWSQQSVGLGNVEWADPTATTPEVVDGLAVYTGGDLSVPESVVPAGALLVAEGSVTGGIPLGSRSYSGTTGTAREVVPTPVGVGQLAVSAETNRQAACRAQTGRNVTANGETALSQLCLYAGATIENTDGVAVSVPSDAQAYLLVTEVSGGDTAVRIWSSSVVPDPPDDDSVNLRSASLASVNSLMHPGVTESSSGAVGLWRPMGLFHLPATGAVAVDQDAYLGACGPNLAATTPGTTCSTAAGSTAPGMALTESVTVIAGSVAAPKDVYIGSPVHGLGALLGAVAFGSVEIPYWAHTFDGALELDATLLALGADGVRQFPSAAQAYSASGVYVPIGSGEEVRFTIDSANGIAVAAIGSTGNKADTCANVSRVVLSGNAFLANCPGDGGDPGSEDVTNEEAPPVVACTTPPCTFRISDPGGNVNVAGLTAIPLEGFATAFTGRWFQTADPLTANSSGTLSITGSVAAPLLDLGPFAMAQFRSVEVRPVNPGRIPPAFPSTERAWKQVQQRPAAPTEVCGDPSCPDWLGGGDSSGGDTTAPPVPGPVTVATGDSSATVTFAPVQDASSYRVLYRRDTGAELLATLQSASCTATCSVPLAGLANGTRYRVQVVAVDQAGNTSGRSEEVEFTPDTAPYAPLTLTATVQGHGQVRLAWPQANAWLEGFESASAPAALTTANSSMSSVTGSGTDTWLSFADTGAPQVGGSRSLLVAAPANSTTTRTTQRVLAPAPQARVAFYLRANALPSSGSVDVANLYSPGLDQLVAGLYLDSSGQLGVRSPAGDSVNSTAVTAPGQIPIGSWVRIDWDVSDSGSQTVRLYQDADLHSTDASAAAVTSTNPSRPARAGRLELGRINGAQSSVNWNIDNVTYAASTAYNSSGTAASGPLPTGYRVFRDGVLVGQTVAEQFVDTSVTGGTTHSYVVRAVNASGQSQPSPTATVLTLPDRPVSLAATAGVLASNLSWASPGGTVTGYRVYRSQSADFPGAGGLVATVGTTTSHTDPGLTAGVAYNYWVVAFNASGEGPRATTSITLPPAPPVITDVSPDGPASMLVTWDAPQGAATYEVERTAPYVTHTFTTNGTFQVTSGSGSVEYLVVGGGGGGGGVIGGGGGGGGVVTGSTDVASGSYAVTVGSGGSGGTGWNTAGQQGARGGNSALGSIIAQGGGGGGAHGGLASCSAAVANGGSGGGGASLASPGCTGSGTAGQGNAGGSATGNPNTGSGGGGAGGPGATATTVGSVFTAGSGGPGVSNSLAGSVQTYGAGGAGGARTAASCSGTPVICTGTPGQGTGGSGFGSTLQVKELAGDARANTGAGGAGAGYWSDTTANAGGNGGSGVVVVRYLASSGITATGGTRTAPGTTSATGQTTTSWSDTTLSPTPEARYRVRACNASGCSLWSSDVAATAPTTAPTASASASGLSATVSWNTQAETSHYEVERNNAPTAAANTSTSITQASLPAGYTHRYRVRACNVLGCGPASAYTSALVQPAVPTNLVNTNATGDTLSYAWDLMMGATSYDILRDSTVTSTQTPLTNTSRSTAQLATGTSYSFQVRACNAAGCSAYSTAVANTTGGRVLFTSEPTASSANITSSTSEGSWTVPPGVRRIAVYARGGAGTAGTDCNGTTTYGGTAGRGARAQAIFTVTPGQSLTWVAGKRGMTIYGGYPAAAAGDYVLGCANQGVAGGGGSQLRTGPALAVGGFASGTDLITAGGGGSGGSQTTSSTSVAGAGGHGGAAGGSGGSLYGFGVGGDGGGGGANGVAGSAGGATGGGSYVANPAEPSFFGPWGGGGGGGNAGGGGSGHGGGGGGGGVYNNLFLTGWGGGGGGGGSRTVNGTSVTITAAENSGTGQVCIAWHNNTSCGPTPPFAQ